MARPFRQSFISARTVPPTPIRIPDGLVRRRFKAFLLRNSDETPCLRASKTTH
jgi:hypothetical protein